MRSRLKQKSKVAVGNYLTMYPHSLVTAYGLSQMEKTMFIASRDTKTS